MSVSEFNNKFKNKTQLLWNMALYRLEDISVSEEFSSLIFIKWS